jgi:hypothetical protein
LIEFLVDMVAQNHGVAALGIVRAVQQHDVTCARRGDDR